MPPANDAGARRSRAVHQPLVFYDAGCGFFIIYKGSKQTSVMMAFVCSFVVE